MHFTNGMAETETGFLVGPPSNDSTTKYAKFLRQAKLGLTKLGIGPVDSVYIAEDIRDEFDLMGSQSARSKRKPSVCDVTGAVAADLLAKQSHRLATPEEIELFRNEQQARTEECERIEANSPDRKRNTREIIRETVVLSPGEAQERGLVSPANNKASNKNKQQQAHDES